MGTKRLTAKNMKETLVNWCGGDPNEYERIRYMFDEMNRMGFVGDYDLLMFEEETWDGRLTGTFSSIQQMTIKLSSILTTNSTVEAASTEHK